MFKRTVWTLTLILLLSGVLISATRVNTAEATQYVSARIVNQLDWTSSFALNSSEYPVNSTFTVNFWLESVTNLETWQLSISWNYSNINFTNAWIPSSNVFSEALGQGADPIVPGASTYFDPYTNLGYVVYGMTTNPTPSITMPGEALMCSMNFTVGVNVPGNGTISTDINVVTSDPTAEFTSFVIYHPDIYGPLISADPATVLIYGPDASVVPVPTPETTLTIYTVDASTGNSTSTIPITVTWQKGQQSDYTEQGAKTFDLGNWTGEVNITAGDSLHYDNKTEPPFNVHAGPQTYSVRLVEKGTTSPFSSPPWLTVIVAVAALGTLVGVLVYMSRKRKVTTRQYGKANPRKLNHKPKRKVT